MGIGVASHNFDDVKPGVELPVAGTNEKRAYKKESIIAVIDKTGDTKHMWDPDSKKETAAAKKLFDDMKAKGMTAYRVTGTKGDKGEVMHNFDPEAGRIIFAPRMVGG